MSKKQTKKAYDPYMGFRASPIMRQQIEALCKAFGENISRTMQRAISETYLKYCEAKKK